MNKEEKEQWLYETYNYTSNFDFSRLDKYEEANDDICIDTLILDYTMLYEFHKEEIKIKNKVVNDLLKRISNLEFEVENKQREIERLNNELEEFEKFQEEHKIMKQILIENNLWETLLNDDRYCYIHNYIVDLQNQLQQKENIIREAREYIEHENFKRNILVGVSTKKYTRDILNKILEILDKVGDKE